MGSANKRRHYIVTVPLIAWAHTQNDPCTSMSWANKSEHPEIRDHFLNAPSQWETTLHCNVVSHWLGAYTKWSLLTHWGRVTHICVNKLTIIGWDNGLSPGRRQAIIWTNAGILLIRTLGTNFSEILDKIHSFSFKKMHLKMLSAKWHLFSLGLNELIAHLLSSALVFTCARTRSRSVRFNRSQVALTAVASLALSMVSTMNKFGTPVRVQKEKWNAISSAINLGQSP